MKHARAIAKAHWPGLPTIGAAKRVVWVPDGKGPCPGCGRHVTPRSVGEDLLGCFDLLLLGFGCSSVLIQVTTDQGLSSQGSTVWVRKKQIEAGVDSHPPVGEALARGILCPEIELWAWVKRCHMRRYKRRQRAWEEKEPLPSPLLKR